MSKPAARSPPAYDRADQWLPPSQSERITHAADGPAADQWRSAFAGAGQVVVVQVSFAALHVPLGDLPEHFPRSFVPQSARLTQQTVGFLQASVLESLLCLPQSHPGKTEHSDHFVGGERVAAATR